MLSPNPVPDRHPDSQALDAGIAHEPVGRRPPLLGLSMTQLVGGSLAAATGAALASRLGVAGTILGAACVSLISAIAGAAYTQSLRTTGARVRTVADRQPLTDTPDRVAVPPVRRRLRPQAVLAAAAAVFAVSFASITGYELFTGQPISGGAGGTTLNEITGTGQAAGTNREDEESGGDPASEVPTSAAPASETGPASPTTSGPPTGSSAPPSGSTSAPPSATDPTSSPPAGSTGSPPPAPPST